MLSKVLFVDDDENLLQAISRSFDGRYDLTTAIGGDAALQSLSENKFSVAIVDMRMPGMTGLELLKIIKEKFADTVRIMLTGNADQQTALDAINEGNIFRFFNKPCTPEELAVGIDAAIAQHNLITAERQLLENTLAGSVKVLVDILSIADPIAYGRGNRLLKWAEVIAKELQLHQVWTMRMSAMLAPIINISIPDEIVEKRVSGSQLSESELELLNAAPGIAKELIGNIPRLNTVADIVYLQHKGLDGSGIPTDLQDDVELPVEAKILKILNDLDEVLSGGLLYMAAFEKLYDHAERYDSELLNTVRKTLEREFGSKLQQGSTKHELSIFLLRAGDYLIDDLKLEEEDRLILAKGQYLSDNHIHRLKALSKAYKFDKPVPVLRKT